jgi:hypothetical protein
LGKEVGGACGNLLRPLEMGEKRALYRFTKFVLVISGVFLIGLGAWYLAGGFLGIEHTSEFWIGIFPAYVGVMMILISLAMRIEWFTDARRFW